MDNEYITTKHFLNKLEGFSNQEKYPERYLCFRVILVYFLIAAFFFLEAKRVSLTIKKKRMFWIGEKTRVITPQKRAIISVALWMEYIRFTKNV